MANRRLTSDIVAVMDGKELVCPDFVKTIAKNHDLNYEEMFMAVAECSFAFMAAEPKDEIHGVVLHKSEWCWENFIGVLTLVANDLHLSAFSLTRNLYENILTTLHLMNHPEKLGDFIHHGRVVAFELARDHGIKKELLVPHQAEYDTLRPTFGRGKKLLPWHKVTVLKMFEESGIGEMYASYYKKASCFAHGDAFVGTHYDATKGGWYFDIADLTPEPYGRLAVIAAHVAVSAFFGALVDFYKLPFKDKWEKANQLIKEQGERDNIRNPVEMEEKA